MRKKKLIKNISQAAILTIATVTILGTKQNVKAAEIPGTVAEATATDAEDSADKADSAAKNTVDTSSDTSTDTSTDEADNTAKNMDDTSADTASEQDENTDDLIAAASKTGTTVYNGVDYSAVYNFQSYINHNADIKAAYGNNDKLAIWHFVNFGMNEGRVASENFDVKSYRRQYSDLRSAYGENYKLYYLHYMICGKSEGRNTTGCTTLVNPISSYGGTDYSKVYDFNYYENRYADLKNAFGDDDVAAICHFINYGMSEGRRADDGFVVQAYASRYQDLQNAYGSNLKNYYLHYISRGVNENRNASDFKTVNGYIAEMNGVDYSSVYDGDYYYSHNGDLAAALGKDGTKLLKHFVEYGMNEGRCANSSFNVNGYYNMYPDLRSIFENNIQDYYHHYMEFGKNEGRNGLGSAVLQGRITKLKGTDYASVYNYDSYLANNPDVQAAYGGNDIKTLQHFIDFGMREGRTASSTFNLDDYRGNYQDLWDAYRLDNTKYYMHYIKYGINEGRIASYKLSNYKTVEEYKKSDYKDFTNPETYNPSYIAQKLLAAGYTREGAAGIMGCLMYESGLRSNNLENAYNNGLRNNGIYYYSDADYINAYNNGYISYSVLDKYLDTDYTQAVDSGQITRDQFVDAGGNLAKTYSGNGISAFGYGLAQWTTSARKGALYDTARTMGQSIGSTGVQVYYLLQELNASVSLSNSLKTATDVNAATEQFFGYFEFGAGNYAKHKAAGDLGTWLNPRLSLATSAYSQYF